MSKKVIQSRLFARKVKTLHKQDKQALDDQVRKIIENPSIGDEKKGDLKGVFVYRFKLGSTLYLLAYRFSSEVVELVMIGPHENYYRDLKSFIKAE